VVTLAFAACNGITYWLWWHKPSDMRCAVPVYLKTSEPSSSLNVSKARQQRDASKPSNPVEATVEPITQEENEPGFLASIRQSFARRRKRHTLVFTILYIFVWTPLKVVFGPLDRMGDQNMIPDEDTTRVPSYYSPTNGSDDHDIRRPSIWTMICVVALFGAFHFIPWSSSFPSVAERSSAISITGAPLLLFLAIVGLYILDSSYDTFKVMAIALVPPYIVSRILLLILPLILLRNLPPTALRELRWSAFSLHI